MLVQVWFLQALILYMLADTVLSSVNADMDQFLGLKSLLSYNYPQYGLGVKGSKDVYIMTGVFHGFRIVKGLNGLPGSISIQSVNHTNHFLRNRSSLVYVEQYDQSQRFMNSSSFYIRQSKFFDASLVFESCSYPKFYIRHLKYRATMQQNDGTVDFQKDASYKIVPMITAVLTDSKKKLKSKSWLAAPIIFPMFLILYLLGRRRQGNGCFSRMFKKCKCNKPRNDTVENDDEFEIPASPEPKTVQFSSVAEPQAPRWEMTISQSYTNEAFDLSPSHATYDNTFQSDYFVDDSSGQTVDTISNDVTCCDEKNGNFETLSKDDSLSDNISFKSRLSSDKCLNNESFTTIDQAGKDQESMA